MDIEHYQPDSRIYEVSLVYKQHPHLVDLPVIRSSNDCYRIIKQVWHPGRIGLVKELKVLLLNQSNKVLGIYNASTGGMSSTIADGRLIFLCALKANAAAIIVCQNNPSAELFPIQTDLRLTKSWYKLGKLHAITLMDYLIINSTEYFSFVDAGYLPEIK